MGMMPANDIWRAQRRIMDLNFRPSSVAKYHAVQVARVQDALVRIMDKPSDFWGHVKLYVVQLVWLVHRTKTLLLGVLAQSSLESFTGMKSKMGTIL